MYTLTHPDREDPSQPQRNPMAILSGESIYIVYPNGEVEALARDLVNCSPSKILLQNCLVWGDLATL